VPVFRDRPHLSKLSLDHLNRSDCSIRIEPQPLEVPEEERERLFRPRPNVMVQFHHDARDRIDRRTQFRDLGPQRTHIRTGEMA
jgi:hypothetical protein